MSDASNTIHNISKRMLVVGIVVVASLGALGAAFLHSTSVGAVQVADNAEQLHWANATLGAAGIVRASLAQAVFFSVDRDLGVASDEAAAGALVELSSNLAAFDAVSAGDDGDRYREFRLPIEDFSTAAHDVLSQLEESRSAAANEIRTGEVEPAFAVLSRVLEERQADMAATIEQTEELAGRISRVAQASVTLLIPAASMLVYWLIVRQRMRKRELELGAKLEAQEVLSRAKDNFIAGVSHELRTPLTSIYGFAEILIDRDLIDQEMELVSLIHTEAGEMSRMVEDLLTSSRLDAGALTVQIEPVDLSDAIDQVVAPVRRRGAAVEVECDVIEVRADPLRIRQIIRNLVSNAHRHGGPEVSIRVTTTDGWAHLVVADNGDGIPDAIRDRLFQRFVNEGRRALLAGSVGLGLAVAQALAHRMGGTIRYNQADGWTLFTVSLPLSSNAEESNSEAIEERVMVGS